MPDDLTRRQPEDPNTVNQNQAWEMQYWAKKFGVSESQLKDAIDEVGPNVANIKDYLGI